MYCVVEFLKDNSVSVVPVTWLNQTKDSCKWPVGYAGPVTNLIQNPETPWNTWEKDLSVRCLAESRDYYKARKLEKKAETTSNLESSDAGEQRKRKRKPVARLTYTTPKRGSKKQKLVRSDSSEQGGDSDSSISDVSLPEVLTVTNAELALVLNETSIQERQSPFSSGGEAQSSQQEFSNYNELTLPPTPRNTNHNVSDTVSVHKKAAIEETLREILSRQKGFEKTVLTALAQLKSDVTEVLARINSNQQIDNVDFSSIPNLPISTTEDLTEFESWLSIEESNVKLLVQYCASIGGRDSSAVVRGMLSRIFSAGLARQINVTGVGGKVKFQDLKLRDVLIKATGKNKVSKDFTEFDIIKVVQNWFKNSRDLNGGRTERGRKNVQQTNQEAEDSQ